MRKADYAALAEEIAKQVRYATVDKKLVYANDDMADGARLAIVSLARYFSARASVDPAEFLKACGIVL